VKSKELLAQLKSARENLKAYKEKRLAATTGAPVEGFQSQVKAVTAKYGVKSLEDLAKINTASSRYKAMSVEDREAVKNFKEAIDVTLMCATIFKKAPQHTKAYEDLVEPALKAFGLSAQGSAWVPVQLAESYVEEYNLDRKIEGLFTDVRMPTNPFEYPVMNNGFIASTLGEGVAKSSKDDFTTSKITFSAKKLSNQAELPEEISEDAAPDLMKIIRAELISGQSKAMEIAILEGDTAGTMHSTSQITGGAIAADSCERAFDGLRKRALAGASLKVDGQGQTVDEAKLTALQKAMGKFGVNPAELVMVSGVKVYGDLKNLDDVRTLETFGPKATVLEGQLAAVNGIAIIVSEYWREDLGATGGAGGTGALGSLLLVNRKRWYTATRRAVVVKVSNEPVAIDSYQMVSFSRRAFQGVLKADGSNHATEKSVALLYNLAC
jgi:HK97 family phage major capsid protein